MKQRFGLGLVLTGLSTVLGVVATLLSLGVSADGMTLLPAMGAAGGGGMLVGGMALLEMGREASEIG
ncbi:MAG: hypothetical protein K2X11_19395 [Acetobacteraceae bacterium]|nr:hypothetical protein [Acetobacteraceae bacterium]